MYRFLAKRMLIALPAIVVALVAMTMTTSRPAQAALQCADLTITNVAVTPTSPVQNQSASIDITVQNDGSCAATGFVVQFKSSLFALTGPSDTVTSLNGGHANTIVHLTYAFPYAGNFLTQAVVDSGNAVNETSEVNNLAIKSVTVLPGGVDLSITNVTFNPDPAVATDGMTATVHVVNTGNTDAGAFRVNWRPGPLFAPLQSQQINGLAHGAGVDVPFNYTYAGAGTFNTTATVDPLNSVWETNEFNNSFAKSLVVDPPLPDLIIESSVLTPASPTAGLPAQLKVKVKNVGHRPAGDFEVQWIPAPLTPALRQGVTGPLAVGADTEVDFNYTFPLGGNFTGTVTADSSFTVPEVYENNNSANVPVTVAVANVDLTITDFHYTPANPIQGQTVTFSATIKNLGNTPAENFVVSVNPDAYQIESPSLQTLTSSVASLAGGASTTLTFPFVYPHAGNFRGIAEVDAFNTVLETNEQNNKALADLVVAPGDTDLSISNFSLKTDLCLQAVNYANPCSLYWKGSAVTATIDVTNNGDYPSDSFTVQWLVDDSSPFAIGPTAVVPGVLPHSTVTVTLTSSFAAAGSIESKATVDLYNQVPETNEGNNTAFTTSTVLARDTSIKVGISQMHVYNDLDDGLAGAGEWNMWLLAYSSGSNCHLELSVFSYDLANFTCFKWYSEPDRGDYP